MSDYYDKKLYIPTVTETGEITGEVERWEAHEKGILHKAFSVALFHQDRIILQIRKHPVFDGVTDVTASSHPISEKGIVESETGAVVSCLKREWRVDVAETSLTDIGSIYYKSPDPKSAYIEHEYCTFYRADIDHIPTPDPEFAYGYVVVDIEYLKNSPAYFNLAPWVVEGMNLL